MIIIITFTQLKVSHDIGLIEFRNIQHYWTILLFLREESLGKTSTVKVWKKSLRKRSKKKELSESTWSIIEQYFPAFLDTCKKNPDELIEEALTNPEIGEERIDEHFDGLLNTDPTDGGLKEILTIPFWTPGNSHPGCTPGIFVAAT